MALARPYLLFPLQEGLEVMFRDALDESVDLAAGLDPGSDRVAERRGDVGAEPLATRAGVKIESGMLLAALAAAVGLAAGTVLEQERAAEQGFVGKELDGARATLSFLGRALGAWGHRGLLYWTDVELYAST
jgi:hypothetical protein